MPPAPHVFRIGDARDDVGGAQRSAMAAPCAPPIASLVSALRQSRAFTADAAYANEVLGPLMQKLDPEDTELQMLLAKFGWCGGRGFTKIVDVKGLQAALQKYQFIKLGPIGNGAYGSVHKVMNRETRELLAIKQVRMGEQGLCDATLREISALQELDHPNIIRLRDVIASTPSKYCYLVLELLETDLYSFLHTRPDLPLRTIKSVMFQVLTGLRHAHGRSIMHRDLKPQNVLLGRAPGAGPINMAAAAAAAARGYPASVVAAAGMAGGGGGGGGDVIDRVVVKIADFGLARGYLPCNGQDGGAYTDWVVTLFYRAPELLLGCRQYGPSVDVWSAGCVLAELLGRCPLFVSGCEIGLLFDMFRKLGTPTPDQWADLPGCTNFNQEFPKWPPQPLQALLPRLAHDPAGADLLSRLLVYDPRRRLSASQALQHPWFDEVREEEVAAAEAAEAAEAEARA